MYSLYAQLWAAANLIAGQLWRDSNSSFIFEVFTYNVQKDDRSYRIKPFSSESTTPATPMLFTITC